jgi:hypothetical protein
MPRRSARASRARPDSLRPLAIGRVGMFFFLVFQLAIGSGEQRVPERLLCRSDLGMHKIDAKQNVQTKEEDEDQQDLNSKLRCRKGR